MIRIEPAEKFDIASKSFFAATSLGILSAKDAWIYNFSSDNLVKNLSSMVDYYNKQRIEYNRRKDDIPACDFVRYDGKKITWTDMFLKDLERNVIYSIKRDKICFAMFRPFSKQSFCYEKSFIQRTYQQTKLFPTPKHENLVICVSAIGSTKGFSAIITNVIPDYHFNGDTQCFPLYYYDQRECNARSLFDRDKAQYARRDGITDFILSQAKSSYGNRVTKEDIFHYVYGFLHSPEYRRTFSADLKKMLPRLPLVEKPADFWAFARAGRALADLHLNYEAAPSYSKAKVTGTESGNFLVEKMRFVAKDDKTTILYNSHVKIADIPPDAYEYVVNGRSAIEWIMERYQVRVDKDSGIRNDPNDWGREHGNPRYILDLLLSVITVSLETMKIVAKLPKLDFNSPRPEPEDDRFGDGGRRITG